MSSPAKSSPLLSRSSESSGAQLADTSAEIIAELTTLLRIVSGAHPITVFRLRRTFADGSDDVIEVPVFRTNFALAPTIIRTIAGLAAKLNEPQTMANETDPHEAVQLNELVRRYNNGSHPSCRIGIKSEFVRKVEKR
jgi:hypothetical protein